MAQSGEDVPADYQALPRKHLSRKSKVESQDHLMQLTMNTFRFEKLEVWQQARKLNRKIYDCTRGFPDEERYALMSQIRRASVSVASNIAEGSGRNSDVDFSRFLEISYGSLMEVISQLYLALDEKYIKEVQMQEISVAAHGLSAQIIALSRALGRQPRRTEGK